MWGLDSGKAGRCQRTGHRRRRGVARTLDRDAWMLQASCASDVKPGNNEVGHWWRREEAWGVALVAILNKLTRPVGGGDLVR